METLTEDIVKGNPNVQGSEVVIAKSGDQIPYYKIKQLPFVLRTNISQTDSLYGISDIDVLENNQDSLNKVGTKIQEKHTKRWFDCYSTYGGKHTKHKRHTKNC